MKFATILAVAAAACVVSGAPLRKRQLSNSGNNDVTILNFALLLEVLEFEFYKTGLEKFGEADFRRANIPNPTQAILNFHHILQHEAKHVETLQAVIQSLGGEPIPACDFNFPMDTVQDFTKLASILEKTGVAAYNGAVNLLENPDLQTAAANIDTIEARHASFLQTVNGLDPFPADFDVALDGRQIVTLAAPVIRACPFELPFAPFGALKVDESKVLLPGDECTVEFQRAGNQQHFCNFVFSDQSLVSELSSDNKCAIPDEARGDVFLMITSSDNGVTLKDTNAVVAGPVVLNIDTAHDDSCQRFVGKDGENTVDSLEVPVHQKPKHEMPPKEREIKEKEMLPAEDCLEGHEEKGKMVDHKMKGGISPEIQAQIDKVAQLREADAMEEQKMKEEHEMKEKEMPAPETPAPETPPPETPALETPAPETPAPETPAPETPAPETPAPETPAPETPAPPADAVVPPAEEVPPADPASDIELSTLPATDATSALVASDEPVLDMGSMTATVPPAAGGETPQMS